MSGDGLLIVVVEDKALRSHRRAFHRHSGAAGNEEDCARLPTQFGRNLQPAVFDRRRRSLLRVLEGKRITGTRNPEGRDQLLASRDAGHCDRTRAGWNRDGLNSHFTCSLGYGDGGTTKRPAASRSEERSVGETV